MRDVIARFGIFGELLRFMWTRKLYWLIPMMLTLFIFAVIIVLGGNPATSWLVYPLF